MGPECACAEIKFQKNADPKILLALTFMMFQKIAGGILKLVYVHIFVSRKYILAYNLLASLRVDHPRLLGHQLRSASKCLSLAQDGQIGYLKFEDIVAVVAYNSKLEKLRGYFISFFERYSKLQL